MGDQREIIEGDLYESLEGDFGLPVELLSPTTGVKQTKSANNPDEDLMASVMYETIVGDHPMGGSESIVHKPFISLRRSSLDEVPSRTNYKRWVAFVPIRPSATSPKVAYRVSRPPEGGETIGFIRLYLEAIEQS